MFRPDIKKQMIRIPGEGCEKLEGIVAIVESERQLFQEDDKCVEKRAPARRQDSKTPTASLVSGNVSHPAAVLPNPKGFQAFRRPTKLSNCRICKVLETRGDNQNLYEDHLGNYATGCPRYASFFFPFTSSETINKPSWG